MRQRDKRVVTPCRSRACGLRDVTTIRSQTPPAPAPDGTAPKYSLRGHGRVACPAPQDHGGPPKLSAKAEDPGLHNEYTTASAAASADGHLPRARICPARGAASADDLAPPPVAWFKSGNFDAASAACFLAQERD
jgi:hypothetical protein